MAADSIGIPFEKVHVMSVQDTDITPFGTGAYASRQTFMASLSIEKTAKALREKILSHAYELTRMQPDTLDIRNGMIVRTTDNMELMSLAELAITVLYSREHSEHITAEETAQIKTNAYSFGCSFAEVEVDIAMCTAKLKKIINIHDCGKIINPALAEAQVHGGISMGIGYALSEIQLVDKKTGKVLNDNFLDYKLSTCMDHPDLAIDFVENPEPTSPYGTKSLGEPSVCPVAPAIRNAVLNATGVAIREGEIQTAIIIPIKSYEGYKGHYIKYAMREAMDIATTGCSVNVKLSNDKKTFEDVRIAYGVAGPIPMRATTAENFIKSKPVTLKVAEEFAKTILEDVNPRDSWRASKAFRCHIGMVMAQRALEKSVKLAGGILE
jgi:aldehyde oxidase and xanthine dehydrogenase molybdopterin binding protein